MNDCQPPAAYLTPAQVAARLGIAKVGVILAHIRAGRLAAVNVGTGPDRPTWRIAEADLSAFLESRRAVPAVKAAPRVRRKRAKVTQYF